MQAKLTPHQQLPWRPQKAPSVAYYTSRTSHSASKCLLENALAKTLASTAPLAYTFPFTSLNASAARTLFTSHIHSPHDLATAAQRHSTRATTCIHPQRHTNASPKTRIYRSTEAPNRVTVALAPSTCHPDAASVKNRGVGLVSSRPHLISLLPTSRHDTARHVTPEKSQKASSTKARLDLQAARPPPRNLDPIGRTQG